MWPFKKKKMVKRRTLSDVKVGERLNYQPYCLSDGVCGGLVVMNNDYLAKKIFVKVTYSDGDKYEALSYSHHYFRNFFVLNSGSSASVGIVESMEREVDSLLKEEKYERVAVLRDAIDKLKLLK